MVWPPPGEELEPGSTLIAVTPLPETALASAANWSQVVGAVRPLAFSMFWL